MLTKSGVVEATLALYCEVKLAKLSWDEVDVKSARESVLASSVVFVVYDFDDQGATVAAAKEKKIYG